MAKTLRDRGVEVFYPHACAVPDQLTPRDIGFVVGSTFFVARMAKVSRRREYEGIQYLLDKIADLTYVPEELIIEGGDIVVDKGVVFVGISQRTTLDGYLWLAERLPNFTVVPVHLKSTQEGEDCLHLDCVFVPVGTHYALVYPEGISGEVPEAMHRYQWIVVNQEEQAALATNVLSLSDNCVISRTEATRVNQQLGAIGLEVLSLKFDEAPNTGGSFRCCTLPLVRRR